MKKYICLHCGEKTDFSHTIFNVGIFLGYVFLSIFMLYLFIENYKLTLFVLWSVLLIYSLLFPVIACENRCPICKARDVLIPTNTTKGREVYKKYHGEYND